MRRSRERWSKGAGADMSDLDHRPAAIRSFNFAAGAALAVTLAVHAYAFWRGPNPFVLAACNLLVIIGLALAAIRAHRASGGRFDSAVGAETVVAFGVLALILGLATAISPLLRHGADALTFDAATLRQLGRPFVQGLVAAGLAPVVAVLLRNASAELDDDPATEADQLGDALAYLTEQIAAAVEAAATLTGSLESAATAAARIGPDLGRHLGEIADAAAHAGPGVSSGVAALMGALHTGGRRFTDEMESAGRGLASGLADTESRVAALAAAADTGVAELSRLSTALGGVSANAGETGELFEALNALTASVEAFVARRQAA